MYYCAFLPNSENILSKTSYRNIIQVAIPMGISIMIPQLSVFANTAFLGNFNSTKLGVSAQDVLGVMGVAGIYYLVFALITYGLATGMLMLMSRRAGSNDHKGVGQYFGHGIILGFLLALVLITLCLGCSSFFFESSLHDQKIIDLAQSFLNIRVWGLPFLAAGFAANMFFVATNNTPYMIISAICQALVNVCLDFVLIYGHLGFGEMGIMGSAYASVTAELVLCAVNFFMIFRFKKFEEYSISFFGKIDWVLLKEMFIKSSPLMLQLFISLAAWEVFFIFIEHLGKLELAASQVLRSLYGIFGIVVWALAHTSNSVVSNLIGQNRHQEVIPFIFKVLRLSIAYACIAGLIIYGLSNSIFELYTHDLNVKRMSFKALPIVLFSGVMFSVSSVCFNAMLGFGETRRTLLYEVLTIAIYLIYIFIVIEQLRLPLWVAWTSEIMYWFVTFSLSAWYIRSKRWITKTSTK